MLIAGFIGLAVALITAMAVDPGAPLDREQRGTWVSLGAAFLVLLLGWWLIESWSDFNRRAHVWSALLMFSALIVAIVAQAIDHRRERDRRFFRVYASVAVLMIAGGILIPATRRFGEQTVFALEAWEIGLFAVYWIAQTAENWNEHVVTTARS